MKRFVIACGGTGGHFYPGYVLALELKRRGWDPLFLLRRDDPAGRILSKEDLPYVEVDMLGMPRGLSPRWPSFLLRLASSLRLVGRVVRDYAPERVIGMGGYLTFPAALAARRRGTPFLVHESNCVLGMANRASVFLGARLAMGLPLARPGSPFLLTGTPIRPEMRSLPPAPQARQSLGLDPGRRTVLVFGGSQGARGVNAQAAAALARLAARAPGRLQCLHLSGAADEGEVRRAYEGRPLRAEVRPYLHEMHLAYAAADLVVCRAGAGTIAELAAAGRPCVLIPYPYAAQAHQDANARLLEGAGAAVVHREAQGDIRLEAALEELLLSGDADGRLKRMIEGFRGLDLPHPDRCLALLADAVEAAP